MSEKITVQLTRREIMHLPVDVRARILEGQVEAYCEGKGKELRERVRKWLVIQGVYGAERLIRDLLTALDAAEREERELSEDQVLKAVYESGLHQYAPGVLREVRKDGIDIDVPKSALMNFVRKIAAIRREGGGDNGN